MIFSKDLETSILFLIYAFPLVLFSCRFLVGASYTCDLKLMRVENGPDLIYATSSSVHRPSQYEVATFGLGCFWGAELAFMREPGVVGTRVGYSQGDVGSP